MRKKRAPKNKTTHASAAPEEKAFRRSDGYYFAGKKMEPFSFLRQSAMVALMAPMGTNPMVELAIAIWLLHQSDSTVHKARRQPEEFVRQVEAFADKEGLGMHGHNLQGGIDLYEALCEDLKASKGKPIIEDARPSEDNEFPN